MFGFGTEYEGLAFWLPLVWAGLLAIAVAMYVIVDGFDLGVGILFKAARNENWRDRMMFSVAPIWDGNETWLILGGGGLFAVFHVAYAILMPALYVPITLMLIALIFRGVAFEFASSRSARSSSGTTPSSSARSSPPSSRAWCSAPSCRASPMTGASSPAAPSTSSPRSACSPASA
jgi:cytochrome bd-type quinol oxidase subunit 2